MRPFKVYLLPLFTSAALLLTGCRYSANNIDPNKITSINIIDRNGLAETISAKDRLNHFQKTDFLTPQPYQKVLRVFARDKKGDIRSTITSYHPNGQIKQCLDAVNNRALGAYREWHSNGQLKIDSLIIGGTADLNTQAEESWLFEGLNQAWDEEGHLLAQIPYNKGELEGEAKYYHPNEQLWKSCPYQKNVLHGTQKTFLQEGALLQTVEYVNGCKEGLSIRHWTPLMIAYQETYQNGKLMESQYFDREGKCVAEIHEGKGFRAIFGKKQLQALQEFREGIQEGVVKIFDENLTLLRTFSVRHEEKEGEEIDYFPSRFNTLPRLLMTWQNGILQGPVKTWYENGNLESQREMSQNKKNGLSTAWYENGSLMLAEEYENDTLLKGEYFRLGETIPISKVERGKGIATLFTADGTFSRKIYYQEGRPLD